MRFDILTKTRWEEPPRIRHQMARMLMQRGHEVLFVERNRWLARPTVRREGALALARHGELLHHQLRVVPWLSRLNAQMEASALRTLGVGDDDAIILNFNYDHFFLREHAPASTIITILNDDFLASARWFARREARRVISATVRGSDHTLVVSRPLLEQAQEFSADVSLFLPWARAPYARPPERVARPEALYWGYINERIDLIVMSELLELGIIVNFVGPVRSSNAVDAMLAHRNARYHGVGALDTFRAVVDRCSCSILAYDTSNRAVAATTISNRAFDLLSVGLPLLYSPLPALLQAPPGVIRICRNARDFADGVRLCGEDFDALQPVIAGFLEEHSEDRRYEQLITIIGTTWRLRQYGAHG